jgi:DNA sulfur modification protein DndC
VEYGADALNVPITVHRTKPAYDQTFWVNLLGRGYPAPNRTFRWCTDRMKIRPTGQLLTELVGRDGGVILLLGVRRAESSARARSIDTHAVEGSLYNPHGSIRDCLVFAPIVDLTDDEVWQFLLQCRPPWGGTHTPLVTLYRNALGGECPFVVSNDDAPSCGNTSPRFGCWTCTVVKKDKSLLGLADSLDDDRLEALAEFRDRLRAVSDEPKYRAPIRRNGQPGLGPLTFEAREMLLDELLALQTETGLELIPPVEVEEVRRTWEMDHVRDVIREADQFLALFDQG